MELHSSCQTISVDRGHIEIVGSGGKDGSVSTYSRTPNRTPGYGSQTPVYAAAGSKTPLLGSQTPSWDAEARTPHYSGSMTPSHDGSMTPRQGAWDPTVTNTPARTNDFDYGMEEPSPSPGYNPSKYFSVFETVLAKFLFSRYSWLPNEFFIRSPYTRYYVWI